MQSLSGIQLRVCGPALVASSSVCLALCQRHASLLSPSQPQRKNLSQGTETQSQQETVLLLFKTYGAQREALG